jgi:hypothetical protein
LLAFVVGVGVYRVRPSFSRMFNRRGTCVSNSATSPGPMGVVVDQENTSTIRALHTALAAVWQTAPADR